MSKFFILHIPVYGTEIFVSLEQTDEQFEKSMEETDIQITNLDGNFLGRTYCEGGTLRPFGIRIRTSIFTPLGAASVFHEVFPYYLSFIKISRINSYS